MFNPRPPIDVHRQMAIDQDDDCHAPHQAQAVKVNIAILVDEIGNIEENQALIKCVQHVRPKKGLVVRLSPLAGTIQLWVFV